jgi:hypothetical protein
LQVVNTFIGATRTLLTFPSGEIIGQRLLGIRRAEEGGLRQQRLEPQATLGGFQYRDVVRRLLERPGNVQVETEVAVAYRSMSPGLWMPPR